MSSESLPLRDELMNILNIVAETAQNDAETDVRDSAIISRANLPREEVYRYLNELRSLGLILEQGSRPAGVDYRLYRITAGGLNKLKNQDLG
jgi:DNA-binding IclR family transcriptional regulator